MSAPKVFVLNGIPPVIDAVAEAVNPQKHIRQVRIFGVATSKAEFSQLLAAHRPSLKIATKDLIVNDSFRKWKRLCAMDGFDASRPGVYASSLNTGEVVVRLDPDETVTPLARLSRNTDGTFAYAPLS